MLALIEQLFTGFSDEELQTFSGLIKKLKSNLQDNPKHNENES
jgi:DNA-binding MarR family transcriptional regulator